MRNQRFYIRGGDGVLTVNIHGDVLSRDPENCYDYVHRVNTKEFVATYGRMCDTDILDIGTYAPDGNYTPPEADARRQVAARLQEEQARRSQTQRWSDDVLSVRSELWQALPRWDVQYIREAGVTTWSLSHLDIPFRCEVLLISGAAVLYVDAGGPTTATEILPSLYSVVTKRIREIGDAEIARRMSGGIVVPSPATTEQYRDALRRLLRELDQLPDIADAFGASQTAPYYDAKLAAMILVGDMLPCTEIGGVIGNLSAIERVDFS